MGGPILYFISGFLCMVVWWFIWFGVVASEINNFSLPVIAVLLIVGIVFLLVGGYFFQEFISQRPSRVIV